MDLKIFLLQVSAVNCSKRSCENFYFWTSFWVFLHYYKCCYLILNEQFDMYRFHYSRLSFEDFLFSSNYSEQQYLYFITTHQWRYFICHRLFSSKGQMYLIFVYLSLIGVSFHLNLWSLLRLSKKEMCVTEQQLIVG